MFFNGAVYIRTAWPLEFAASRLPRPSRKNVSLLHQREFFFNESIHRAARHELFFNDKIHQRGTASLPASLGRLATGKSQIEVCVVMQAVAGAERREALQVRALQERVAREAIAVAHGDDLPAKDCRGRVCRQRRRRARGQRRRGGRAAHPAAATANDGVQSPGMQAQWPGILAGYTCLVRFFVSSARTYRQSSPGCVPRAC